MDSDPMTRVPDDDQDPLPQPAADDAGPQVAADDADVILDLFPRHGEAMLGSAAPALDEVLNEYGGGRWTTATAADVAQTLRENLSRRTFGTVAALTSGRDLAVEWAIAAARRRHQGQKFKIITFVGSYHGQTLACRAASGDPRYQRDLGPLVAGFIHCPAEPDAVAQAIDDQTAAILVQPIHSHDGFTFFPDGFLTELRRLADQHELLLIIDESQFPIGSSGQFACHTAVPGGLEGTPDGLILSAGLAGGLPFGAVIAASSLAESTAQSAASDGEPLAPLLPALANATLQAIDDGNLLSAAATQAEVLKALLAPLREDFEFVRAIRQCGLMVALELDLDAASVQKHLLREGMLVGTAGAHTLRLQPALTVTEATIRQSADLLRAVFQAVEREPAIT